MARRTGKEALHERIVEEKRNKLAQKAIEREARLAAAEFDDVSEEDRDWNLKNNLRDLGIY